VGEKVNEVLVCNPGLKWKIKMRLFLGEVSVSSVRVGCCTSILQFCNFVGDVQHVFTTHVVYVRTHSLTHNCSLQYLFHSIIITNNWQ
jgi:hypothetical protein